MCLERPTLPKVPTGSFVMRFGILGRRKTKQMGPYYSLKQFWRGLHKDERFQKFRKFRKFRKPESSDWQFCTAFWDFGAQKNHRNRPILLVRPILAYTFNFKMKGFKSSESSYWQFCTAFCISGRKKPIKIGPY